MCSIGVLGHLVCIECLKRLSCVLLVGHCRSYVSESALSAAYGMCFLF